MWPIWDLRPHPDNPRGLNEKSPKFLELVESIRINGVLEPLTVRINGGGKLEVLSGHRRLAAAKIAGRDQVPIRNLGQIPDDLAFDIVAMSNLHEDLTPLEEGKRAATWLDKYHEDAKAVAAKLGKTEHFILQHAQIERNLIPGWKKAAVETDEELTPGDFSRWTAAHWVLIARLPAAIQEYWLGKIQKDYRFDPRDATVEDLGEWLATEKLFLAKAPFPAAEVCLNCPKRTDAISQLLWPEEEMKVDQAEEAVRCLDPKCWERKSAKAVKQEFQSKMDELIEKHGITGDKNRAAIVPICLAKSPAGEPWSNPSGHEQYRKQIRNLKKSFGRELVEEDRITVVKEGTKGSVPGIVVAGKGRGTLKWVKIAAKTETSSSIGRDSAADRARDEQRKKDEKAAGIVFGLLAAKNWSDLPEPKLAVLLLIQELRDSITEGTKILRVFASGPEKFYDWYAQRLWKNIHRGWKSQAIHPGAYYLKVARTAAKILGIEIPPEENQNPCRTEPPAPGDSASSKTRSRRARGSVRHKLKCRVCGCTDDDCSQCIAKTGKECHWVQINGLKSLCSACVDAPATGECPVEAGTGECTSDGNCKTCPRAAPNLRVARNIPLNRGAAQSSEVGCGKKSEEEDPHGDD